MATTQPLKIVTGITQQMATTDEPQFGGLGIGVAPTTGLLSLKTHSTFTSSQMVMRTYALQTPGGAATALFSILMAEGTAATFEVRVVARQDADAAENGVYWRIVRAWRPTAGAATLGTVVSPVVDQESGGMTNCDVTFSTSGNNVLVTVTGLAATNINWTGTLTYQVIDTTT